MGGLFKAAPIGKNSPTYAIYEAVKGKKTEPAAPVAQQPIAPAPTIASLALDTKRKSQTDALSVAGMPQTIVKPPAGYG